MQVGQEVLVGGKGLVVLDVMHEAQGCIEGLDFQGALHVASPLPSRMDSLGIQDMVRGQREPMGQEVGRGSRTCHGRATAELEVLLLQSLAGSATNPLW